MEWRTMTGKLMPSASGAPGPQSTMPPSFADLYDGAMLGCFLQAAAARSIGERFSVLRTRMNEYLASAGCAAAVPESSERLDEELATMQRSIARCLAAAGGSILDGFVLGAT